MLFALFGSAHNETSALSPSNIQKIYGIVRGKITLINKFYVIFQLHILQIWFPSPAPTMPRSTCRILRHKPNVTGIELGVEGWVNIEDLIARAHVPLTPEVLLEVVETRDKKRFAISADGQVIGWE